MSTEAEAAQPGPRHASGGAPGQWIARRGAGVVTAIVAVAAAAGLGLVPFLGHAWGLTLWRYLAPSQAVVLAALTALLCVPVLRDRILDLLRRVPTDGRLGVAALMLLTAVLFLMRVRLAFGDSRIIYFTMSTHPAFFFFPDVGATFFLQMGARAGRALGVGGLELVQALICLCAPLCIWLAYRAARLLAPNAPLALCIVGLILANGMLRIFAGHLEVYAFVLVTALGYAWAGLAYLRGQCAAWVPPLVFGLGLFVHIQYLFLVPSLMLLFVLREPGKGFGDYMKIWMRAAPLSLLPIVLFFCTLLLLGQGQDLVAAVEKMIRWSDVGPTPDGHEAWIRLWGGSGPGTRYLIFSPRHLKYLTNAFFLIAPFTFVVLLAYLFLGPKRLVADDDSRFLALASATSLLYAAVVRPVYGPYDWDLFSLTAAFLGLLAGHLLVRDVKDPPLASLFALVIGAGLLIVTIPFLIVGVAPAREAGPFSTDLSKPVHGEDFTESFERQIEPWL